MPKWSRLVPISNSWGFQKFRFWTVPFPKSVWRWNRRGTSKIGTSSVFRRWLYVYIYTIYIYIYIYIRFWTFICVLNPNFWDQLLVWILPYFLNVSKFSALYGGLDVSDLQQLQLVHRSCPPVRQVDGLLHGPARHCRASAQFCRHGLHLARSKVWRRGWQGCLSYFWIFEGQSINDVTQVWRFFDPPVPLNGFIT